MNPTGGLFDLTDEVAIITGSSRVGNPIASGSGVNTARVPPWGATLATAGSEQAMRIIMPSRAGASR